MNEPDFTTLIAHQGESEDAPGNTLPAVRAAVEHGFGFECDCHLSADGKVFLSHDGDLGRITGGAFAKKCRDATWDEIRGLDVGSWGKWAGSAFAGTRPPLLGEVLPLARDGRRIYLELKPGPEIVPYVKAILDAQSAATPDSLLFISFNEDTCRAVRKALPDYRVYVLAFGRRLWLPKGPDGREPPVTAGDILDTLRRTGADGIDCEAVPEAVTEATVAAVHDAGFSFHVWTVDDLPNALDYFRRGVDTVTTNRAKRLLDEYVARNTAPSPAPPSETTQP